MNNTHHILIRDPYLSSATKTDVNPATTLPSYKPNQTYGPTFSNNPKPPKEQSKWNMDLHNELEHTKNQFKRMTRAYTDENRLNRRILDYQAMNSEYHQSLKLRNLDLNNKLIGLATDNKLLNQQLETDHLKSYADKENFVRKYQIQCEEILQLKKTVSQLLQVKGRMEQELQRLQFIIDNEAERFNLQVRQQVIRIEGMERSMKNMAQVKDTEISQLRNRLRIYQDQNKRLNDENRTLILSNKDYQNKKTLENISQIHHLDSQMKSQQKQNFPNFHNKLPETLEKQLHDQKTVNDNLQRQINQLKKKLFDQGHEKKNKKDSDELVRREKNQENVVFDFDRLNGYITSIITLRNGINKEVFDVFFKSVRDGEKHRSNSLVLFIQNWTHLDIERLQPYMDSYFDARNCLKQMYKISKDKGHIKAHSPTAQKTQQCIPLHINSRKGRSQINQWILSTIQFTKNQKQSSKKSMNNLLLFLFRLLTIQYRITYPMQGKSYTIDSDVRYQLLHEIVKAIDYIRKFK